MILIIKIITILLGGIFGTMALIVEYKDHNKKITRWGRIALVGVVLSSALGVVAQSIEYSITSSRAIESSQYAAQQSARTNELLEKSGFLLSELAAVKRAAEKIEPKEITIGYHFPPNSKFDESAKEVMKSAFERMNSKSCRDDREDKLCREYMGSMTDDNNNFTDAYIEPKSKAFIELERDPAVLHAMTSPYIGISFVNQDKYIELKKEIGSLNKAEIGNFGRIGGYGLSFGTEYHQDKYIRNMLVFSAEENIIESMVTANPSENNTSKDGTILSVYDIKSANLIVCFMQSNHYTDNYDDAIYDDAIKELIVDNIKFRLNGRIFLYYEPEVLEDNVGNKLYVFNNPKVDGY